MEDYLNMNKKLKYEVILFVTLPFSESYFVNIPLFLQREKIRFNIFTRLQLKITLHSNLLSL